MQGQTFDKAAYPKLAIAYPSPFAVTDRTICLGSLPGRLLTGRYDSVRPASCSHTFWGTVANSRW